MTVGGDLSGYQLWNRREKVRPFNDGIMPYENSPYVICRFFIAGDSQRSPAALARQVGYRNVESVVLWSNLPLRIDVAPTE